MNAKLQMLNFLEMIKNVEITEQVFLSNPAVKFKMALKEKMVSEGISEENVKTFLKVFKADLNDDFVNDPDLMEAGLSSFTIALQKLVNVSQESSLSVEDMVDLMGDNLSITYNY